MNRGELCELDGRPVLCTCGWGEGRPGLLAGYVRLEDGQRFLWLADEGIVEVAG